MTGTGWPDIEAPLSFGIKTRDRVYISGMAGFDMKNKVIVPGGIKPQTTQALKNIAAVAEAGGTSMAQLTSCSISMANITRDFKDMNDAYAAFFPKDPPARTAVQVAKLAGGSLVEIQCVAASLNSKRYVVKGPPNFPLSAASTSSNIIFASGVQGRDEHMRIVTGGIANETTAALQSLEATLAKAGSDLGHVVHCTVYISDMTKFNDMNTAYKAFWPDQQKSVLGGFPSRICSQASEIAGGANVEITCIAVSNEKGVAAPKVITVPGWKKLEGFPLSIATSAEGMVFASGLQGWNTTTMTLVPGGIAAETTQALKNMGEVFKAAGADFAAGAVECEVSLVDLADFDAMNKAYSAFWSAEHPPPARVSVQVAGLAKTAKVEIKCTGVLSTDMESQDVIAI